MDKFIEVTNNIVVPITYLGSYCTDIKTSETLWEISSSNKILLNTIYCNINIFYKKVNH